MGTELMIVRTAEAEDYYGKLNVPLLAPPSDIFGEPKSKFVPFFEGGKDPTRAFQVETHREGCYRGDSTSFFNGSIFSQESYQVSMPFAGNFHSLSKTSSASPERQKERQNRGNRSPCASETELNGERERDPDSPAESRGNFHPSGYENAGGTPSSHSEHVQESGTATPLERKNFTPVAPHAQTNSTTDDSDPSNYLGTDFDREFEFLPKTAWPEVTASTLPQDQKSLFPSSSSQRQRPCSPHTNKPTIGTSHSALHSDQSKLGVPPNRAPPTISNAFLSHWHQNLWAGDGLAWNNFVGMSSGGFTPSAAELQEGVSESKSLFCEPNPVGPASRSEEKSFGSQRKSMRNELKDEISQEKEDVAHLLRALAQRRGLVTPQSLSVPVYDATEFVKHDVRYSQAFALHSNTVGGAQARRIDSQLVSRTETTTIREMFGFTRESERKFGPPRTNEPVMCTGSESFYGRFSPRDYGDGKAYTNHTDFAMEKTQREVFNLNQEQDASLWSMSENYVNFSPNYLPRGVPPRGLPPQAPPPSSSALPNMAKPELSLLLSHDFHDPMLMYNNFMYKGNLNFSNSNVMNSTDPAFQIMSSPSHSLKECGLFPPFSGSRPHTLPSPQGRNSSPSPRSHFAFRSDHSPYSNIPSPGSNLSPSPRSNYSSPRSSLPPHHDSHIPSPTDRSSHSPHALSPSERQRERARGNKRFNRNTSGDTTCTPPLGADLLKKGIGRSILNELCMKRGWPQPEYALVKEDGPAHLRRFSFCASVVVDGVDIKSVGEPMPSRATAKDSSVLALMNHLKSLSLV